ncbi:hypothetical protein CYMTET_28355 [Cymbomonas tetramitiformis]|uniref:Pentose-5-phosphate 3-epimerase n=1 Tax=Cymbomonas tetramitiformis TaxID=36881 RepID=A0AAE0FN56_9CHLO|nr:hypothetical protein CYMTET_28355 [Cymbomonas tetramitiformis]
MVPLASRSNEDGRRMVVRMVVVDGMWLSRTTGDATERTDEGWRGESSSAWTVGVSVGITVQAAEVAACGDDALRVNSGGAGPVSAEWMVPKSLWLKRNEPEVYAAAHFICEYQDYMNFHLTGRMCASINNVSVRWHYSAERGGYPASLLDKLGLGALLHKWPKEVLPLGARVGGLTEAAARHLGLPTGLPVAQGGADAFIGMIGLGVLQPGELALLTGSSHLHLGVSREAMHGKGMFGSYADCLLPGTHVVEGGQTSTGSVISWYKRMLGEEVTYDILNAEAEAVPPGCEGLAALDHFQGNRTPHTDAASRGALVGLTLKHTRGHIFRALIEAVCFGTALILDTMRSAGYNPKAIVIAGGATRSPLWLQVHADVCGLPLRRTRVADACSLGSAILAAVCAGSFADVSTAVQSMVHVSEVVEPNPRMTVTYAAPYLAYKNLYPALSPLFHASNNPAAASTLIAPSILAGDFSNLEGEATRMAEAGAEWLHVDICDGQFCGNLTIGAPVVKSLRSKTRLFLDCHLAVMHPESQVQQFAQAGADQLTFHPEAAKDSEALAVAIRTAGMKVGVALQPGSPTSVALPLLQKGLVDTVNVMAVEPGFGGQPFQEHVLEKVRELRDLFPSINIQVDGGVNPNRTAKLAKDAGANILIAGTSIFGSEDPKRVVSALKQA